VTTATLVQQFVTVLMSSMQVRLTFLPCFPAMCCMFRHDAHQVRLMTGTQAALALLGLSDGGITPSAEVAAAIVADRVIELLAIHAELAAAVAVAAGNHVAAGHGVMLVRTTTSTHMQPTKPKQAYHCRCRCFWHGAATDGSRGLSADALHGGAAERTSKRVAEPAPQFASEHRWRLAWAGRCCMHTAAPQHAAGAGSIRRHIGAGRSRCCAREAGRRQDTARRSFRQAPACDCSLAGAQCCWRGTLPVLCVRWRRL
jgi:hypothetical protein